MRKTELADISLHIKGGSLSGMKFNLTILDTNYVIQLLT